jgi:hypothetical protein
VDVKTAVGKPGLLHQVRDADAIEAALAEELRGRTTCSLVTLMRSAPIPC